MNVTRLFALSWHKRGWEIANLADMTCQVGQTQYYPIAELALIKDGSFFNLPKDLSQGPCLP